jgi:phenylacetate-CoA ligase
LLQRHGKLLRVGTQFISPLALQDRVGKPIQMVLDHAPDGMERLRVFVSSDSGNVRQSLLTDEALSHAVNDGFLTLDVHECAESGFTRNTHSGKTPLVIDHRLQINR